MRASGPEEFTVVVCGRTVHGSYTIEPGKPDMIVASCEYGAGETQVSKAPNLTIAKSIVSGIAEKALKKTR